MWGWITLLYMHVKMIAYYLEVSMQIWMYVQSVKKVDIDKISQVQLYQQRFLGTFPSFHEYPTCLNVLVLQN